MRVDIADQDGEIDEAVDDEVDVTVTVSRLDGSVLLDDVAATVADPGQPTATLTSAQTGAGLDVLTAVWSVDGDVRASTVHEVVGRHWFAPSRLNGSPGVEKALANAKAVDPTRVLLDARTWIESLIEWSTGAAWVPRTELEQIYVPRPVDEVLLAWPFGRTLRSVSIDGVDEDVDDWVITRHGTLARAQSGCIVTYTRTGLAVRYDHGASAPTAPLLEAALIAAADRITSEISTLGNRLTGTSGEFGTISYASIDRDHPTGILAVDAQIALHDHRTPGVG